MGRVWGVAAGRATSVQTSDGVKAYPAVVPQVPKPLFGDPDGRAVFVFGPDRVCTVAEADERDFRLAVLLPSDPLHELQ